MTPDKKQDHDDFLAELLRQLARGDIPTRLEDPFPTIGLWFPLIIPAGAPCYFGCSSNRTDLEHEVALLHPTTLAVLCGPVRVGWLFGGGGFAAFLETNGLKNTGLASVYAQIQDLPHKKNPYKVVVKVTGT